MRHLLVWIAAVLMLCRLGAAHAVMPVPSATGYLTDRVGLVEPADFARIQVMLGRYEATSGRRISVLLVDSTPGESLEDFADRVLADWRLDQTDKGAALLVWSGDGYVLIRPSSALAVRLDEEAQSQILSRWVVPGFARGEPAMGLRQGVEQMMAVLDGGTVAEAPPESGPVVQEMAPEEAFEFDAADGESEGGSDTTTDVSTEAAVSFDGLPEWIERLPEDLRRLAAPFSQDIDAGVMGWLRQARSEAAQLPVQAPGLLLQMQGERVEPPFPGLSVFAVYAWALSMGILLLILLSRRAFISALVMAALDTGFFLWLATGFVALGGLLVLLGLLAPVLVPLLRVVLRGSDDSERDDLGPTMRPMPGASPRASVAPAPARPARVQRSSARPAPATSSRAPAGVRLRSPDPATRRLRIDVLLDRLGRIAAIELRRLRLFHAGILLVLLLISPPLAVLVVLGLIAVSVYRSGAAYLIVDAIVSEQQVRDQLKRQLPRPSADVMPPA